MTRKHLVVLAAALARSKPIKSAPQMAQWRRDVEAINNACAEAYSGSYGYDSGRFFRACGYYEEEK